MESSAYRSPPSATSAHRSAPAISSSCSARLLLHRKPRSRSHAFQFSGPLRSVFRSRSTPAPLTCSVTESGGADPNPISRHSCSRPNACIEYEMTLVTVPLLPPSEYRTNFTIIIYPWSGFLQLPVVGYSCTYSDPHATSSPLTPGF